MSKSQTLRALVNARLTAAAQDIFALFERTIAEYEEELCRSRDENQRKQQLPSVGRLMAGVQSPATAPGPGPTRGLDQDRGVDQDLNQGLNQDLDLDQESPQPCIKEEPEEQIVKQEQHQLPVQVDGSGIGWMDDGRLAVRVPAYGEKLAVRPFRPESGAGPSASHAKRHSLLQRLKGKTGVDGNGGETEAGRGPACRRPHAVNNTWAKKKTRKIELGWIHEGRQVRKRRGGGTRTVTVPRETTKAELLSCARDLFFPHGENHTGTFRRASSDIVDFRVEPILDDNVTVGDLYDVLKRGMLRFYLSTKDQCCDDEEEEEEERGEGPAHGSERHNTSSGAQFERFEKDRKYVIDHEEAKEDLEDVFSDVLEVKIGPQGALQLHDGMQAQLEEDDL